jgi:hypothetical protein
MGSNAEIGVEGSFNNTSNFDAGALPTLSVNGLTTNSGQIDLGSEGQLFFIGELTNTGTVSIGESSQTSVSNLTNENDFTFSGLLDLSGNLTNSGINFNSIGGALRFSGTDQQLSSDNALQFTDIFVEGGGNKVTNTLLQVSTSVDLDNGFLDLNGNDLEMMEPSASIIGGTNDSYILNGGIIQRGTGFKNFPLGVEDELTRVEFVDVVDVAADQVYKLTVGRFQPSDAPVSIGPDLIAIYDETDNFPRYYWQLDSIEGDFGGSIVKVFSNSEVNDYLLNTIQEQRNIGAPESRVSIVQANAINGDIDTIPNPDNGTLLPTDGYITLNDPLTIVESIPDVITSDLPFTMNILSLAKGGLVPEDGVYYLPNAFSPQALDQQDQVIRVYGERIDETADFIFQVFDRRGLLVYEATDFLTASTVGWDGTNSRNGAEVEGGTYSYRLQLQFTNGRTVDKIGTINYIK